MWRMLLKETSNNDGQQFNQYQQNQRSPLTLTHWTQQPVLIGSHVYLVNKLTGVNNTFNNILVIVIDCCLTHFSAMTWPEQVTIIEEIMILSAFYESTMDILYR